MIQVKNTSDQACTLDAVPHGVASRFGLPDYPLLPAASTPGTTPAIISPGAAARVWIQAPAHCAAPAHDATQYPGISLTWSTPGQPAEGGVNLLRGPNPLDSRCGLFLTRFYTPANHVQSEPVARTELIDGLTWTVTRSESSVGPCLEVTVFGRGHGGSVGGGCGRSGTAALRWSLGGINVAGTWYNVAYGQTRGAASLAATLGDGTVVTDRNLAESHGLWLIVHPGGPNNAADEISALTAMDAEGRVTAHKRLPSLAAVHHRAQRTNPSSTSPHS